jgi:hypothetical protein
MGAVLLSRGDELCRRRCRRNFVAATAAGAGASARQSARSQRRVPPPPLAPPAPAPFGLQAPARHGPSIGGCGGGVPCPKRRRRRADGGTGGGSDGGGPLKPGYRRPRVQVRRYALVLAVVTGPGTRLSRGAQRRLNQPSGKENRPWEKPHAGGAEGREPGVAGRAAGLWPRCSRGHEGNRRQRRRPVCCGVGA